MIAIAPSSWIAFFSDRESAGDDTALVESALFDHHPDSLIAQSCIDHGVRLVTRDEDFRHFARLDGLRLALQVSPVPRSWTAPSRRRRSTASASPSTTQM